METQRNRENAGKTNIRANVTRRTSVGTRQLPADSRRRCVPASSVADGESAVAAEPGDDFGQVVLAVAPERRQIRTRLLRQLAGTHTIATRVP